MARRSRSRDYPRTARLNELLREIIAEALDRIDDDRLPLVTVTSVDVDADLKRAVVYIASLDEDADDETLEALGEARVRLQGAVAREARIKRTPELVFRIDDVLRIVTHAGCQTNALVGHFGQVREAACGHCTFCETQVAQVLPERAPVPAIATVVDAASFAALRDAHPRALGASRQAARFLCGLSSPALTRDKLSRHPLFGSLDQHPFAEVLAWCER